MIDILHRYTKAVLYHSETAQTIAEAVSEALRSGANLRSANLRSANLRSANLRSADLQGANLWGANLWGADLQGANLQDADLWGANLWGADLQGANLRSAVFSTGYRIASLCFGGWGVTVGPTETKIGCEQHPNEKWLTWSTDAPEIAAMHSQAATWWTRHREAVCAVIRDVMQP